MGFLDKNTRVIDMILTDYGRELYSKGELEFVYYAFSDDGVDYDPYIENSGTLTSVQLNEEKEAQIEATLVREAIFGHQSGMNFEAKDETNIKNLLFTVPQGQTVVPELSFSPEIITGSIEAKQQKVIERFTTKDSDGDKINVLPEFDRGYRKFKSQKLVLDIDVDDYFEKSSRDGYLIKMFESGSDGLIEMKHKRDKRYTISFSNDIQVHGDEELASNREESIKKLVK